MDKVLQVFLFVALMLIGVSAALSIRAHYRVWRYAPPQERLPERPS